MLCFALVAGKVLITPLYFLSFVQLQRGVIESLGIRPESTHYGGFGAKTWNHEDFEIKIVIGEVMGKTSSELCQRVD